MRDTTNPEAPIFSLGEIITMPGVPGTWKVTGFYRKRIWVASTADPTDVRSPLVSECRKVKGRKR